MDNFAVVFAKLIDENELKEFSTQHGGVWQGTEQSLLQAHFPQIDGGVFLRGIRTQKNDVSFLSSVELAIAQNNIGIVRAMLTIDFSKNAKCREEANRIAALLAEKWGGFLIPSD